MTMPPPSQHSGWTVTSQAADSKVDTAGNLVNGVRVYFVTGSGQESSVFVPNLQYNPDTVRQMIEAAATQVDAVASLSAPPAGPQ